MNPSIIDYIAGNYISLILLVGLTVIITLNKDAKIPAVGSVYLILLLAFAVIVSEMVTEWASEEMSRVSVNYAMTALRYRRHQRAGCAAAAEDRLCRCLSLQREELFYLGKSAFLPVCCQYPLSDPAGGFLLHAVQGAQKVQRRRFRLDHHDHRSNYDFGI